MAKNASKSKTLPIYILNGPNLNLLGTASRRSMATPPWPRSRRCAPTPGRRAMALPSSSASPTMKANGRLSQEARTGASRVIINPAGYTPHLGGDPGRAADAEMPVIEVHLSNPPRARPFAIIPMSPRPRPASSAAWARRAICCAVDAMAAILPDPQVAGRNENAKERQATITKIDAKSGDKPGIDAERDPRACPSC